MGGVGFNLSQSMRLSQMLAPQMRQALKMLQMTSLELRAELQHAMETNPVIEDVGSKTERQLSSELPDDHAYGAVSERELDFRSDGGEIADVLGTGETDDGFRDYFLNNLEGSSGDEDRQSRRDHLFDSMVRGKTLQQHLLEQIPLSDIPQEDRELAEILIGDIDEDGFFRGETREIGMVTGASEEKILGVLGEIRLFDPPGCGARNLGECWLSQMDKLDDSPWENEIREMLTRHFDLFSARREAALREVLKVTADEYKSILAALATLDHLPGRTYAARTEGGNFTAKQGSSFVQRTRPGEYVTPEVFTYRDSNGDWCARVDGRDLPEIHISKRYQEMLNDPSSSVEVKSYIRERIRAAEALRDAVKKRQETIRLIAQAIIDAQPDFFTQGMKSLKPLTMQQIADVVGVVGTTVSRTVRDKYMSTPFGVVEMRRFFTSGLSTDAGEAVSNTAVKSRIKDIIAAENREHPLSDEQIGGILKGEGVKISRRTVAKYRIALGIPGAIERRIAR